MTVCLFAALLLFRTTGVILEPITSLVLHKCKLVIIQFLDTWRIRRIFSVDTDMYNYHTEHMYREHE